MNEKKKTDGWTTSAMLHIISDQFIDSFLHTFKKLDLKL